MALAGRHQEGHLADITIARLTITLDGIAPVVSRTLKVPTDIRFEKLHLVMQGAMGWENCHLYEFTAGQARWSLPDPDFSTDTLPLAKARLADVIDVAGTTPIRYVYDFGDHLGPSDRGNDHR